MEFKNDYNWNDIDEESIDIILNNFETCKAPPLALRNTTFSTIKSLKDMYSKCRNTTPALENGVALDNIPKQYQELNWTSTFQKGFTYTRHLIRTMGKVS